MTINEHYSTLGLRNDNNDDWPLRVWPFTSESLHRTDIRENFVGNTTSYSIRLILFSNHNNHYLRVEGMVKLHDWFWLILLTFTIIKNHYGRMLKYLNIGFYSIYLQNIIISIFDDRVYVSVCEIVRLCWEEYLLGCLEIYMIIYIVYCGYVCLFVYMCVYVCRCVYESVCM